MANNLLPILHEHKEDLKIFYAFTELELDEIAPSLEIVRYPGGSVIFKEGDAGDFLGFIVSGKIEVRKQTEFKARQVVLAVMTKGSFVGELNFLDEQPRSATVIATVDSELLILKREAFDSYAERHPHAAIKILKGLGRVLSIRLRRSAERFAEIF